MNKIYIYITGLLFLTIALGSCHDELLNPEAESILTTANAYNNSKDINLAVLGIYNRYQSRVQTDYELMEAPADNMYAAYFATAPGLAEIDLLNVSPVNEKLNSFWKDCYNGIFRANSVLVNIDKPDDYATGKKEQFTGEAKFMRALFYFDLVRIFGGVPAVTSLLSFQDAAQTPRASEEDVYKLIINDLEDAVKTLPLPTATPKGRASNAAALALLAKVQVYRKNWPEAKKNLELLFTNHTYSLLPNYADLFEVATENNNETIFQVPFVSGTNGQGLTYALAPLNGIFATINNGSRVGRPTWDLHRSFDKADTRFKVTITENQLTFNSKATDVPFWYPYFNKWIVPSSIPTSSALDIPVIRMGDMVLLYSEVLYFSNNPGEALKQLNRVRERAFGNTTRNYVLADISTEPKFIDKLLLERRFELAVENNRWFDLVRTGRFTTVLTSIDGEYNPSNSKAEKIVKNAKPYMKYFPIPYEQIQLAGKGVLVQNEGYD